MPINANQLRRVVLETVNRLRDRRDLTPGMIIQEVTRQLGLQGEGDQNRDDQQALLTIFYDLFREGHLAWGLNSSNPEPPFCHVTDQGRNTLEHLDRDPANPDGYNAYLSSRCSLGSISQSYVSEALKSYNSDCPKAAAVMIGAAAESMVLDLRDTLVSKMRSLGQTPTSGLSDWRIKTIYDAITALIDPRKNLLPQPLREAYDSFWQAFGGQLRITRNDAGHPRSIDPVTWEITHSSLLIFPEFAKTSQELTSWISSSFS